MDIYVIEKNVAHEGSEVVDLTANKEWAIEYADKYQKDCGYNFTRRPDNLNYPDQVALWGNEDDISITVTRMKTSDRPPPEVAPVYYATFRLDTLEWVFEEEKSRFAVTNPFWYGKEAYCSVEDNEISANSVISQEDARLLVERKLESVYTTIKAAQEAVVQANRESL